MKRLLPLLAIVAIGCDAPASLDQPSPAPTPPPSASSSSPAQPSSVPASPPRVPVPNAVPDPIDGSRLADFQPSYASLDPSYYVDGELVALRLGNLPARSWIELWHVGRAPEPEPRDTVHPKRHPAGTALASGATGPDGQVQIAFRMPKAVRGTARHELWLVLPPGDVLARVAAWEPNVPTTITGTVYDEDGRPVGGGTVYAFSQELAREQEVSIRGGRYRIDGFPLPTDLTLAFKRTGWPTVVRRFWAEDVRGFWARMGPEVERGSEAWTQQATRFLGSPVTMDFGGPGSALDPAAPAYFASSRADEEAFGSAAIAGRVFDEAGLPVPTAEGLEVVASDRGPGKEISTYVRARVMDGRYRIPWFRFRRDATNYVELVHPSLCGQPVRFEVPVLPTGVIHRDVTVDFGGPGRPEDPEAPAFPFRRTTASPCPTPWASAGFVPTASPPAPF